MNYGVTFPVFHNEIEYNELNYIDFMANLNFLLNVFKHFLKAYQNAYYIIAYLVNKILQFSNNKRYEVKHYFIQF